MGAVAAFLTPWLVGRFTKDETIAAAAHAVAILTLAFLGLALRGIGELRGTAGPKAAGYFAGAIALAFTVSLAMTGEFPLLFS